MECAPTKKCMHMVLVVLVVLVAAGVGKACSVILLAATLHEVDITEVKINTEAHSVKALLIAHKRHMLCN